MLSGLLAVLIFYSGGFRVKTVVTRGFNRVPASLAENMVTKGESIFKVKPGKIKKRLETLLWIKKAKVIRKFPGTVVIDIKERVPIAMVSIGGDLFYVDVDGSVFKKVDRKDNKDLPVAIGFGREEGASVSMVIKLFSSIPELKKLGISHIIKLGEDISVFTMDGVEFILDGTDIKGSLRRAGKVVGYFERKGGLPRFIDVRIRGRAICRG